MRIVLVLLALLCAAAPAAAQSSSARMTASATVVAPVRVDGGAAVVAAARGGSVDVTRPLAVQARAPWVLEVRDGIGGARHASSTDAAGVTVRLALTRRPSSPLVYTVSMVN